jgi:large subunit ribosomal protein L29
MAKLKLKQHNETLRGKTLADLRQALINAKEEMFNLRFQRATGNLENHRNIRKAKREIARIHTAIREKELAEAGKGEKK